MTRVLAAFACLVFCIDASAAELISRRDFAKRMEMAFRAAAPNEVTRADENEIVFRGPDDGIVLTMPEAYAQYAAHPGRLDEIIRIYVRITLKTLDERPRDNASSQTDRSRTSPAAKGPLSRRAFMERIADAFRSEVPGATVSVVGDHEIEVRGSDRIARVLSVADAYDNYRRSPERLDEILTRFVEPVAERIKGQIARAAVLDPSRIIPVVRDRQWLEENISGLRARGLIPSYVLEDLTPDLVIIYAEDLPERTRFLVAGVDAVEREGLRARALENLLRLIPKAKLQRHGNLYVSIAAGGDYGASLLLHDGFWSGGMVDGAIAVDGEIVVAIPSRATMLVTGSRNQAGIAALRDIVAREARGPGSVSRLLFVHRNGQFEKFEPSP